MIYSKGAAGEVTLDGTVSDPVACPSLARRSVRRTSFRSSARRAARAVAASQTPVRLLRAVVNGGSISARRCASGHSG